MSLLQIMEFVLGSIDTWPTAILKSLFIEEPTPSNINTISAFFYGNGIPFYMASYFFNLRNDRGSVQSTNIMRKFFLLWQCLKFKRHFCVYYNTTFRKLMWLNGRAHKQMEDIVDQVPDIPLGIEGLVILLHSNEIGTYTGYCDGISLQRYLLQKTCHF